MENGKRKEKGKNNQIFGSIIQSSQPSVILHSTIYANLVFSPRIPIFFLVVISSLAFLSLSNLSPASLAEKPFFSLRISARISFPLVPTCCEIFIHSFCLRSTELGRVVWPDVDPIRRCGFCDC